MSEPSNRLTNAELGILIVALDEKLERTDNHMIRAILENLLKKLVRRIEKGADNE